MERRVIVSDLMQKEYVYYLTEPAGRNFHPEFTPGVTPKQMLALGVFGGKYMTDCRGEFPEGWFEGARLCHERHVPELNYSGSTPPSRLPSGGKKAGSTMRTPGGGSSGTAGTTRAEGARTTSGRSGDGKGSKDTSPSSRSTAGRGT